jgi:hypothetical protein
LIGVGSVDKAESGDAVGVSRGSGHPLGRKPMTRVVYDAVRCIQYATSMDELWLDFE